jgi:[acyl-carrier-protein] S-malonyltransferase
VLTGLARRTLPDAAASAVATPDDLDTLVNAIAGSETWHAYAAAHQGEHLYTSERVVISPSAGVFEPRAGLDAPAPGGLSATGGDVAGSGGVPGSDGAPVAVGDLLGTVGTVEVRTPFAGMVVGFMAHRGERVAAGEPIAWLRVQADQ